MLYGEFYMNAIKYISEPCIWNNNIQCIHVYDDNANYMNRCFGYGYHHVYWCKLITKEQQKIIKDTYNEISDDLKKNLSWKEFVKILYKKINKIKGKENMTVRCIHIPWCICMHENNMLCDCCDKIGGKDYISDQYIKEASTMACNGEKIQTKLNKSKSTRCEYNCNKECVHISKKDCEDCMMNPMESGKIEYLRSTSKIFKGSFCVNQCLYRDDIICPYLTFDGPATFTHHCEVCDFYDQFKPRDK
jgi:hypothetical protein